ncbi:Glycerol-3-phosphate acyltransferase 4 [Armadillidium nasatum]|uniref:Glycerol-3-phosphate acyltransferase 4 n=1 Tax=Armadillidium nasatum TaxID=96803 RepID=A0A5N5SSD2_9CRUS|nr:Glycerol-3-phosphate acyltransferase 4 [Armadillidium nasatum]
MCFSLSPYRVVISPETPVFKKDPSKTGHFHFEDPLPYISVGMQAIVEDIVGKTFTPAELSTWNMLSRTKRKYKKRIKKSRSVTSLWLLGVFIRYVFFVPVRLVILAISLTTMVSCTFLVGRLPDGEFKKTMNAFVVCWCFDFVASALSVVGRFHDRQNRPTHGIAVANHTSPIDSMVLATDNCYDMVGQKTGGFLGVFMKALSKSSTHIWFERSSTSQRNNALNKMLDHSQNPSLPPILIFPEGACVNNTSVLLFRKGVFGFDADIYPIAVKFDRRYGDAFWYKHGFFSYCLSLMTSWAIVCDIWYLPPMRKQPDESPLQFAGRVKSAIARKGGLTELDWDGFIKVLNDHDRHSDKKVEKEKTWLKKQQMEFAKHLKPIENEPSI